MPSLSLSIRETVNIIIYSKICNKQQLFSENDTIDFIYTVKSPTHCPRLVCEVAEPERYNSTDLTPFKILNQRVCIKCNHSFANLKYVYII